MRSQVPPSEHFGKQNAEREQQRRDVDDALRIDGSQFVRLYEKMQALIANLQTTVTDLVNALTYTKPQIDSKIANPGNISPGSVTASGSGSFPGGLSSSGAYNTDVSSMAGARQSVWQHNSGVYGYAPSTIESKVNLGPVPFTAADVLAVQPWLYQYRAQIAIREDPDNPYYDPEYAVPWEIGLMAEHLIAHNMDCFVVFHDDGVTPKTIDYSLFGAIAPLVVLADLDQRMRAAGL